MATDPGATPIISAAELAARLEQTDPARDGAGAGLVVLDATLFLPNEGMDANQQYLSGHIPGARRFDIDLFADPDTTLPHMVPAAGRFARLIGALGVGPDSAVVVYDQRGLFSAARAWWLLRLFGHDRVAVLDGGLPAWRAAGLPIAQGEPAAAAAATFLPALNARRLRGLGDVRDNIGSGGETLLDARSAARFSASIPEPRPGLRGGHVPGARNLPFGELLDPDFRLRPAAALRAAFAARDVDGTGPVVTMCGSGVTATILTLAMATLGWPEGAVYDGSWTEWASHPDTPVER